MQQKESADVCTYLGARQERCRICSSAAGLQRLNEVLKAIEDSYMAIPDVGNEKC